MYNYQLQWILYIQVEKSDLNFFFTSLIQIFSILLMHEENQIALLQLQSRIEFEINFLQFGCHSTFCTDGVWIPFQCFIF
jgi:hypothetical protein